MKPYYHQLWCNKLALLRLNQRTARDNVKSYMRGWIDEAEYLNFKKMVDAVIEDIESDMESIRPYLIEEHKKVSRGYPV